MVNREDEHFADVTLACEGHSVKAHRIILCACSSYFQHILRSINPAQHPVLLLSDVRPTDLTALMDFIYFGQVGHSACWNHGFIIAKGSVGDPEPDDPHVFGPPGSGSISQRYGPASNRALDQDPFLFSLRCCAD
jgi:hypothetical protein